MINIKPDSKPQSLRGVTTCMYFTFYVDVMEWCSVLTRSTQCYLSENNFSEETIQLRRREIAKLFYQLQVVKVDTLQRRILKS